MQYNLMNIEKLLQDLSYFLDTISSYLILQSSDYIENEEIRKPLERAYDELVWVIKKIENNQKPMD